MCPDTYWETLCMMLPGGQMRMKLHCLHVVLVWEWRNLQHIHYLGLTIATDCVEVNICAAIITGRSTASDCPCMPLNHQADL